jgi:hypothetical protein
MASSAVKTTSAPLLADYYDVDRVQDALESYHTDWMDGL